MRRAARRAALLAALGAGGVLLLAPPPKQQRQRQQQQGDAAQEGSGQSQVGNPGEREGKEGEFFRSWPAFPLHPYSPLFSPLPCPLSRRAVCLQMTLLLLACLCSAQYLSLRAPFLSLPLHCEDLAV